MTDYGIDTPENARQLAIQRLRMKKDFRGILAGGFLAVIVTVLIWWFGGHGYFWPVWIMLGVAIPIVAQGWKAHGPDNRITEADVQREMARSGPSSGA
jgi:hypothetical protein